MIRTFRIAYALKNTYRVNGIIYSIKQIPLLRRILPETLYRVRGFKILANVLSGLWEAVSAFLGKLLYLLVMVFGVCAFYEWIGLYKNGSVGGVTESRVFLHIFFLLTVIGAYKNTYLFEPSNDKYYAISLMRMNARNYMVSYFGYMMLRLVVGFLPFTILLGRLCGVPLWICVLLPFFVAGGKLISVSLTLRRYEKTGKNPGESAFARWDWILVVLLLAAAYGLPALGIVIPDFLITGIMILVTGAGLLSVKKVVDFPCYCQLCRQMLADQKQGMDVKVTSQNIVAEASRKKISRDTSITSNKKGLEYFNELFVKRHKKILWNSEKRITGICLVLLAVAVGGCIFAPEFAKVINEGLMKVLPVFLFVMYLVNRGTTFTQALFINCDHSMLTYAFYKKPGTILKLFWIRLRELVKINLLSAWALKRRKYPYGCFHDIPWGSCVPAF